MDDVKQRPHSEEDIERFRSKYDVRAGKAPNAKTNLEATAPKRVLDEIAILEDWLYLWEPDRHLEPLSDPHSLSWRYLELDHRVEPSVPSLRVYGPRANHQYMTYLQILHDNFQNHHDFYKRLLGKANIPAKPKELLDRPRYYGSVGYEFFTIVIKEAFGKQELLPLALEWYDEVLRELRISGIPVDMDKGLGIPADTDTAMTLLQQRLTPDEYRKLVTKYLESYLEKARSGGEREGGVRKHGTSKRTTSHGRLKRHTRSRTRSTSRSYGSISRSTATRLRRKTRRRVPSRPHHHRRTRHWR